MSRPRRHHQLPLPTTTAATSVDDAADLRAHWRERSDPPPADTLVHLRCPGCAWTTARRLARAGRPPAALARLLPRVPVRHWVFSLGPSAQPKLCDDRRLRIAVARGCVQAVFAGQRRAAARARIFDPACGALTAIHRVDAALCDDVHVHALIVDGVYHRLPDGTPEFIPLPPPRRRELRRMTAELRTTLDGLLARAAPTESPPRSTTRVVHRTVAGPIVQPVPPRDAAGLVQRCGELDVRAGPLVPAEAGHLRARLCRYLAREPFDITALDRGPSGRLRYRLHRPFADGTTHVELSTDELTKRLDRLLRSGARPPIALYGMLAPGAAAAWLPARPTQLALLPPSPRNSKPGRRPEPDRAGHKSPTAAALGPLRCPRCRRALDIVAVEPCPRAA